MPDTASFSWIRLAGFQAVLLLIQCVLYFGIEAFEGAPHDVERSIDKKIPFIPESVYVYMLWFPVIALFPLALYQADPGIYAGYITAIAADILISCVIYYIYPTSFTRPVPPDTFSGRFMQKVYSGSYKGVNCAPSMHCSMCYLVIIAALLCPTLPLWISALSIIVSVGIVISTMTTKQHVFIDASTALPLAFLCWGIGVLAPAEALARWIDV